MRPAPCRPSTPRNGSSGWSSRPQAVRAEAKRLQEAAAAAKRARTEAKAQATAEENAPAVSCGLSFTAATRVVLASGAAAAISSLTPGQKVLATDTATGKTQAKPVAAVLVNHDTNRYDLKVRAGHHTAVIHTTANHAVWDATAHRWVKAAALRHGAHLRTPSGTAATVLGGSTPRVRSGWMWDLTITGDHDFYVAAATTAILVHNCDGEMIGARGTQVTSTTLLQNDRFQIDVENPAPGSRPGQLHLQDYVGNKYQYNFETGQFEGLPGRLARIVARDPSVGRAVGLGFATLGWKDHELAKTSTNK